MGVIDGRKEGTMFLFLCLDILIVVLPESKDIIQPFRISYLGKLTIPWKVTLFEDNEFLPEVIAFYCIGIGFIYNDKNE